MYVVIDDVAREPDTGLICIEWSGWLSQALHDASEPAIVQWTNHIGIFGTITRIKTDANGWYLTSFGDAVDPQTLGPDNGHDWQYETVNQAQAVSQDHALACIADAARGIEARGQWGDGRDMRQRRDDSDPDGSVAELRMMIGPLGEV